MPDYAELRDQAVDRRCPAAGRRFAGQADDPFFLDLRVFDLLYGGDLSEVGKDTLTGYNVNTIALQVPSRHVALNGDADAQPRHRRLEHDRRGRARALADGTAALAATRSRSRASASRW